jgi:hypothetical protein
MLSPEFCLAVSPRAGCDDSRWSLVDTGCVERYRCAEATAEQTNTIAEYFGSFFEKRQCVLRVLDLIEADDASELAITVTATAHIETKNDIAPIAQHPRRTHRIARTAVTTEAMQDNECWPLLSVLQVVGDMDRAG